MGGRKMKTVRELIEILDSCAWPRADAHVHTHLCDGKDDMTVANIAEKAEQAGIALIILTPHFHKQVSDDTETIYRDSDPANFPRSGKKSNSTGKRRKRTISPFNRSGYTVGKGRNQPVSDR